MSITIDGSDGNDELVGGAGDDTIFGGGGGDTITGGDGNDTIEGDYGGYRSIHVGVRNLTATPRVATMAPTPTTTPNPAVLGDTIYGGNGDDTIITHIGNDKVYGEAGNDYISGGDSAAFWYVAIIDSGEDDDVITFQTRDGEIHAGSGNDTVTGVAAQVTLGSGDDKFTMATNWWVHTNLDGGDGYDQAFGLGTLDGVTNVEYVTGTLFEVSNTNMPPIGKLIIRGTNINAQNVTNGVIDCMGRQCFGGSGDDVLTGTDQPDTFRGGAGTDTLDGKNGRDVAVYTGNSTDYSITILSSDTILVTDNRGGTNDGIDTLTEINLLRFIDGDKSVTLNGVVVVGTDADEVINGGSYADQLDGAGGNDTIAGRDGNDILIGGTGADNLSGGDDTDELIGGTGDDMISGGGGGDTITGGDGNDTIEGDYGGYRSIQVGARNTTPTPRVATMAPTATSIPNPEVLGDTIYGGDGDDTIITHIGNDKVYGEAGNDYISGGDSAAFWYAAIIDAGEDDDVITFQTRDGEIHAGSGNDTVTGVAAQVTLGSGDDKFTLSIDNWWFRRETNLDGGDGYDQAFGLGTLDGVTNVEYVEVGTVEVSNANIPPVGTLIIRGTNIDAQNVTNGIIDCTGRQCLGGTGDDVLTGTDQPDTFRGGAGNDTINGKSGQDIAVYRGNIADYTVTEISYSSIQVKDNRSGDNDGSDVLTDINTLRFNDGDTPVTFAGLVIVGKSTNEVINGGPYADRLDGAGGNDTVNGLDGNDTLLGGVGNDKVSGGEGDDSIDGGIGIDQIDGSDGDDEIIGGAGDDTISGGGGGDIIMGGDGNDTIGGDDAGYSSVVATASPMPTSMPNPAARGDTIYGGDGNDAIITHIGNDRVYGEAGNDSISEGDWRAFWYAAYIDGGTGNDIITFQTRDGETHAGSGNDTVTGIAAKVTLGSGDDMFTLSTNNWWFRKDTTLDGGDGYDQAFGLMSLADITNVEFIVAGSPTWWSAGTLVVSNANMPPIGKLIIRGTTIDAQNVTNGVINCTGRQCFGGTGDDVLTGTD